MITRQWTPLPNMQHARRALCAVALPDGVYVLGGYDGQHYLSSIEKLDPTRGEWLPLTPMLTGRCSFSAVVTADCKKIVVIGGYAGQAMDTVECYGVGEDVCDICGGHSSPFVGYWELVLTV